MINIPITPLNITLILINIINIINKGLESEKLKINDISKKDENEIEFFLHIGSNNFTFNIKYIDLGFELRCC